MDPTETVRDLRELAKEINRNQERATENETRFAELFGALDKWITNGGFLPQQWAPSKGVAESEVSCAL